MYAPTSATTYSLFYGTKAILPIEVVILLLRLSLQDVVDDENYQITRLHELEMLDE